jgi:hypothetical protein
MTQTALILWLERFKARGIPFPPILYNFVVDVFSKMLFKAAQNNLIRGLLPGVVPGGVISLQYVGDTILFLVNDVSMAQNLKWILTCFEQNVWDAYKLP